MALSVTLGDAVITGNGIDDSYRNVFHQPRPRDRFTESAEWSLPPVDCASIVNGRARQKRNTGGSLVMYRVFRRDPQITENF